MPNILTEAQIEEKIKKEISIRDSVRELEYKNKFEELKQEVFGRADKFILESISTTNKDIISTEAELSVYKPIISGILEVFKNNGIKNVMTENSSEVAEYTELLSEAVGKINELRSESERLKRMYNIYKTITEHLSGLDKNIIEEAISKFKDKDLSEAKLEEELTRYILTHKGDSKKIQLESIADDRTILEIDSLLEGDIADFKPKKDIKIKGLSTRKVLDEANSIPSVDDDDEANPAKDMLAEWQAFDV